ncbi:MAG: acyltransferase family protein [Actinophytocola sp.]|nr:acyltransferase family protein [Actinophytocola sp.]
MMPTRERAITAEVRPSHGSGRLHGLDLLRVLASCFVVFGHILSWFSVRRESSWLDQGVATFIVGPLHLNSNLSFAGVGLFFLVSGVVVTHATDRERSGQFLFRRLARLAPLLWAVTLIAWFLINRGLQVSSEAATPLGVGDLLRGMVLAHHLTYPSTAIVGVTWTLLHQTAFYILVALCIPILRRRAWLAPAVAAVVCFAALLISASSRTSRTGETASWLLHTLGQFATYIPLLCIGQVISLVHRGKISGLAGFAIGTAHYLLFAWSDRMGGYTFQGGAMPRTALLLILLVLLTLKISGPISRSAWVGGWARRTYAIYLVHLGCVFVVMDGLVPLVGHELAMGATILTVAVVAEALHRVIERPVDAWLRHRRNAKRGTVRSRQPTR